MPHVAIQQPSLRNFTRPVWQLERSGRGGHPDVVRLGTARVALSDIAGFEAREDRTSYRHGRFLAALLFAFFAGCIVVGVTSLGWPWRYMLAAFILVALSAMALQDVYLANASRLYRFRVTTRDGRAIEIAVPDAASAAALSAVLAGRG